MTLTLFTRFSLPVLLVVVAGCDDWAGAGRERCENLMDSVAEMEGPPESVVASGSDEIWYYSGFVYTFMADNDSCRLEFEERS